MGFSSLATYVILFTVGLSLIAGFILTFRDFFARSSVSLEERQEISRSKLMSDIEIINQTYNVTNVEKNKTWETSEDFGRGILENITISNELYPNQIVLSFDNTSGYWISEIVEIEGNFEFTTLFVEGVIAEPIQSSVELRIRTANNLSSLTGNFIGPDGTEDSHYSINVEENINNIHQGNNVIQLRVDFERLNEFIETPSVDSIAINYEYSNILELRIRNSGKVRLDHNIVDLFVNTRRVSRNSIVLREVIHESYMSNPGIWEPERDLIVYVSEEIEQGTNVFTAINEFGTKSTRKLEI